MRRGLSNELLTGVRAGFAEDLRRELGIIDDPEDQPLLIRVEMPQQLGHVRGMQLRNDFANVAFAAAADHLLQGGEYHPKTLIVLTLHRFTEWHFRNTSAASSSDRFAPDGQADSYSESDREGRASYTGRLCVLYRHLFQQVDMVEDFPGAENDCRQRIIRKRDR